MSVLEECHYPNWDGFGAVAVSQDSLRNAHLVLESLPLGFPLPSIGAEPDGQVTLEWYRSPTQILSVSVAPDGHLHYAGLFGSPALCSPRSNRRYGTEVFDGKFPEAIKRLIREVCDVT